TPKDIAKGVIWIEKAAEQNVGRAMILQGILITRGLCKTKMVDKLTHVIKNMAEKGDDFAQYSLALLSLSGEIVPPNAKEALRWIQTAARSKNVYAMDYLGLMYYKKIGISTLEPVIDHFLAAAKLGHGNALFHASLLYWDGVRGPQIPSLALEYLEQAAELGQRDAEYLLGNFYLNGVAVHKDLETAIIYLTRAAEQGQINAQYLLGNLYLQDEVVPQDRNKAIKLLRKAADQGDMEAKNSLTKLLS
ncbi:MAG: sel1 repeat family protein, partial [Deltaproteobacteria bacterium]|nr:sel1 repeat family protein [Deltaproteobacteria bacterium]